MQIPLEMPGAAPRRTGVGHFLNGTSPFRVGFAFLHLDGIKEFERATMARIGHCQDQDLTPLWQCILPARQSRPAQSFQTNCVDQYQCAKVARLYPNNA